MPQRKTFFITGTGTEVGKTMITAGIAALCVKHGLKTAVMKPVQTGIPEYPVDLETVSKLVPGLVKLPAEIAMPYCFELPASPHLAAARENTAVDPQVIKDAVAKTKDFDLDVLLLEGAGGLKVPLRKDYMTQDLIKELALPVIVTALAGLGTINHTLLTVSALQQANMKIAGIVFNMMPENPGPVEQDNVSVIGELADVPVLGVIREMPDTAKMLAEFDFQTKLKKLLLD